MRWPDALSLAGLELRRRPGRAALTLTAVALGAALLSALVSIAGTAQTRVLSQLSHGGPLASITVSPAAPDPTQAGLDNPRPGPARDLTVGALDRIRRLPHVTSVVAVEATGVRVVPPVDPPAGSRLCRSARGACPAGATPSTNPVSAYDDRIVGVDLANTARLPVTILAGGFPAPGSQTQVDVTQGYLNHLGLSDSQAGEVLGTDVRIGAFRLFGPGPGASLTRDPGFALGWRWTTAEIVGVVDQQAGPGQILAWPALVNRDFEWTAAGRAAGDSDAPTSPYAGALVASDQLNDIGAVRNAIGRIGYSTSAPQNIVVSVGRYLHVVELVLTGIGLIALAIAALGISNALLAAVRERGRQIGVLKAIGARDTDIVKIFLIEAGALGAVGGVVGTFAGSAAAFTIGVVANAYLHAQGLKGVTFSLSPALIGSTIAGSTLVALVAGIAPALRAARLPARQAVDS